MPPSAMKQALAAAVAERPDKEANAKVDDVSRGPILACRAGELPEHGWSSKWNDATKRAALLAALQTAQMHVVYALRPRSSVFQEDVGSTNLEQSQLDSLLMEHATGKLKAPKTNTKEAIAWLLDEGASLEALSCHSDFGARAAAASILASLGHDAGARASALLSSCDSRSRATAAEALGMLPDVTAASSHASAVAKLLEDDEPLVRMAAVTTLGKFGAAAAPPCAEVLFSKQARAREAAAEVMGKIGPAAAPHAGALAELLADNDWQVPTAAANALKRIGVAAVPYCADVLARCGPMAQAPVTEALIRLGGTEAAEAAAELLSNEDAGVRRHAIQVLGAVGGAAAAYTTALSELSSDEDRGVRKSAREVLQKLGARPSVPALEGNGDPLPEGVGAGDVRRGAGIGGKSGRGRGRGSSSWQAGRRGELLPWQEGPMRRTSRSASQGTASRSGSRRNRGREGRVRGRSRSRRSMSRRSRARRSRSGRSRGRRSRS